MFAQFKLMILSFFMAGNVATTDVTVDMDHLDNIKEVVCLSQAVHGEAGNQSYKGKLAVAYVIMNRTKDDAFPDNVCGVIRQKGQFDFKVKQINERKDADRKQMEESIQAAVVAFKKEVPDPTNGSLYFANLKLATDTAWLKKMKRMVRIDDHWFYAKPNYSYRMAMNSDR